MAIARGVKSLLWLEDLCEEIGFPQEGPSILFTDSAVAIRFLNDEGKMPNKQTRHLRIRTAKIKQYIAQRRIKLQFVPGHLNCADMLTKPLPREVLHRHIKNMMVTLCKYLH